MIHEKDIELVQKQESLQYEEEERNRLMILSTVLLLALILAFYFYRKQKQTSKDLFVKNEENKVLLKEVHHRVKNNLQLISSILSLEESETKEEQTKKILKTTKDRIQSISLIYTKLYQDTKIREVELKVYMEDLMNQLLSLSSNVELDLNIDPVKLELDQMIPLGLILN